MSDKFDQAWRALIDSVTQHPSTKPYRPLTIREQQLETEVQRMRAQIVQCIALLRLMVDPVEGLPGDDDEVIF